MPAAFDLIAPGNEGEMTASPVAFTWAASSDADPYDEVEYTLVWAEDALFTEPHSVDAGADTTAAVDMDLETMLKVYWKVVAGDLCGGETECGQAYWFGTGIPDGDANGDGTVNVGDAVYIINYSFNLIKLAL